MGASKAAPVAGADRILASPEERRSAVLGLFAAATRRLRVTLFRCDDYQVIDALAAAAARGVAVEALVTGCAGGGRKKLGDVTDLLERLGITVRRYADRVVKYHAKYAVADDAAALVASLNFTRKCLDRTCDFVAVTTDPEVVGGLCRLFDADAGTGSEVDPAALSARLIVGPETARQRVSALLSGARSRICVIDPNLTDPGILTVLEARRAAGVDVILFQGTVGELQPHGRLLSIDGEAAVVGSLSLAALKLDFRREVALVVTDVLEVRRLDRWVEAVTG